MHQLYQQRRILVASVPSDHTVPMFRLLGHRYTAVNTYSFSYRVASQGG